MILVFLGSWRSTLIVVISIPLSILVSISVLHLLGHTLNVMTLGGLALAVGILGGRRHGGGREHSPQHGAPAPPWCAPSSRGAQEIAALAFVATLCICIVFVPVAFIKGAARSLFVPLALAVVLAMLTSYGLLAYARAHARALVAAEGAARARPPELPRPLDALRLGLRPHLRPAAPRTTARCWPGRCTIGLSSSLASAAGRPSRSHCFR